MGLSVSLFRKWILIGISYLVGGLNPSEKYESIGMIIPNIWENKQWQPNHQPGMVVCDPVPNQKSLTNFPATRLSWGNGISHQQTARRRAHLIFCAGKAIETAMTGYRDNENHDELSRVKVFP